MACSAVQVESGMEKGTNYGQNGHMENGYVNGNGNGMMVPAKQVSMQPHWGIGKHMLVRARLPVGEIYDRISQSTARALQAHQGRIPGLLKLAIAEVRYYRHDMIQSELDCAAAMGLLCPLPASGGCAAPGVQQQQERQLRSEQSV